MQPIYLYILKRKLSDILNQKKALKIMLYYERSESHCALFVDNKLYDLLEYQYENSLERLICQKLDLSYQEGYHKIDIEGHFELIDNNLFLKYDLKEIDYNPINYQGVTTEIVQAYVKENTKHLKDDLLLLGSEYDDEAGYVIELADEQNRIAEEMKARNTTLPTEAELWNRLRGDDLGQIKPKIKVYKPWWKFW